MSLPSAFTHTQNAPVEFWWRYETNRPFPSSPGPLLRNEGRCSVFDMEIIFHSHANKTHFHKKGCAPSLILKVRVFVTLMCPISSSSINHNCWVIISAISFYFRKVGLTFSSPNPRPFCRANMYATVGLWTRINNWLTARETLRLKTERRKRFCNSFKKLKWSVFSSTLWMCFVYIFDFDC